MDIEGSVVLVTGANRGLGAAYATLLLANGAKVYGGARDPSTITIAGVIPVKLDITSAADIAAAVALCSDVNLLINNAGVSTETAVLAENALDGARREMETNFFGTLAMSEAFAPVLERNGGGTLVNMLSVLSWISFPNAAMYCASKAASWSLTNALRVELKPRGTHVLAVHCGYIDTDMVASVDAPKTAPETVAKATLDAIRNGDNEVLVDDVSRFVRAGLSGPVEGLYPQLVG